jgi:hypothetical protein
MPKISFFSRSNSSFVERFFLVKLNSLKFSTKNNVAQGPRQDFLDRSIMVQSFSGSNHEMGNAGVRSESKYEPWVFGPLSPQKRQGTDEAISVSHISSLNHFLPSKKKFSGALQMLFRWL